MEKKYNAAGDAPSRTFYQNKQHGRSRFNNSGQSQQQQGQYNPQHRPQGQGVVGANTRQQQPNMVRTPQHQQQVSQPQPTFIQHPPPAAPAPQFVQAYPNGPVIFINPNQPPPGPGSQYLLAYPMPTDRAYYQPPPGQPYQRQWQQEQEQAPQQIQQWQYEQAPQQFQQWQQSNEQVQPAQMPHMAQLAAHQQQYYHWAQVGLAAQMAQQQQLAVGRISAQPLFVQGPSLARAPPTMQTQTDEIIKPGEPEYFQWQSGGLDSDKQIGVNSLVVGTTDSAKQRNQ